MEVIACPTCSADVAAGNRLEQGPLGRGYASAPSAASSNGTSCSANSYFRAFNTAAAGGLEDQAVTLLKWALLFFVISIIAGILGFTGVSAASADIARFLFYVFVVIFLVLLILGLTIFRA
jgi:uncharacterized membrane protein YtjA (UPF0391 family)